MAIDYPEQHRREALIGTIVLHVLLLLLFILPSSMAPIRRSKPLRPVAVAMWS